MAAPGPLDTGSWSPRPGVLEPGRPSIREGEGGCGSALGIEAPAAGNMPCFLFSLYVVFVVFVCLKTFFYILVSVALF